MISYISASEINKKKTLRLLYSLIIATIKITQITFRNANLSVGLEISHNSKLLNSTKNSIE